MALQTKEFSVTGKSSGGGITYTYLLRVTENSISIADNTSNLTVQAILKQNYSGTAFSSWNTGVSCSLGGKEVFSDYRKRRLDGTAEHIYHTWTGDVAHDSDGTLQLTVGGALWQSSYASFSPPAMEVRGVMALTAIPRASEISARDAAITGASRVTVSRYDAGFTHSIRWEFGELSGYLDESGAITHRETAFGAEAVDFSIPESFYGQIPDAPDGICTLTCTTYHGGAAIGTDSCHFTIRADESLCAPTLTAAVEDCNPETLALTGDAGVLVAGKSHALCSVTAAANHGASVVSVTAGGLPADSGSCVIEGIETGAVEVCVTDSRGFTARQTVTLPLVAYIPLGCNPSVKRTDPTSGNAVLTLKGSCFAGSFGAADNALTVTVEVGEQTLTVAPPVGIDHSYDTAITLSGLDYTCAHTLTVTAQDRLGRVVKTLTVPKGEPVFDWGERDFRFHVPVTGDFSGSFQGVYLRTRYLGDTDRIQLQTRYQEFSPNVTNRQSIFLFGSANGIAVYGLLTIHSSGGVSWAGTEGVTATVQSGGQVVLTLPRVTWDTFTALSAELFEIL